MNLQKFRSDRDMSRRDVIMKLEEIGLSVTESTLKNWEDGNTEPQSSDIVALSKVYGITTDELLK